VGDAVAGGTVGATGEGPSPAEDGVPAGVVGTGAGVAAVPVGTAEAKFPDESVVGAPVAAAPVKGSAVGAAGPVVGGSACGSTCGALAPAGSAAARFVPELGVVAAGSGAADPPDVAVEPAIVGSAGASEVPVAAGAGELAEGSVVIAAVGAEPDGTPTDEADVSPRAAGASISASPAATASATWRAARPAFGDAFRAPIVPRTSLTEPPNRVQYHR
jgi:hypothetical protein